MDIELQEFFYFSGSIFFTLFILGAVFIVYEYFKIKEELKRKKADLSHKYNKINVLGEQAKVAVFSFLLTTLKNTLGGDKHDKK